ncbi:DUF1330 domain-containing protein [Mycobacterium hubeiense]|uniref:DUF1330 domain-containing protein n=1 Tax=Mycobacterium hubeiense TaxID=1867256 RepID=UPI000C7EE390|nr:DUF1330 domain-containing protein [Mycobacterium sp. QGD 101]
MTDLAALNDFPADEPIVMVNLLKFKQPGGLDSYLRYGAGVTPLLERAGAKVRYGGSLPTAVIGDDAKPWWDVILVVEYPTPAAFLEMVTSEEYATVHVHREAALERGELIATSNWSVTG